jgi:hypothetical protein
LAILAQAATLVKYILTFPLNLPYVVFDIRAEAAMGGRTWKGLVRGDVPLARFIFNDESKRRLVPQLQKDGWPIFDVAGKRSGLPDELTAHARKAMRSGRAPRGTKAKRNRRKAAAGAASADITVTTA